MPMPPSMRLDHVPADVRERQLSWRHGLLIGAAGVAWVVAACVVSDQAFLWVSIAVLSAIVLAAAVAPVLLRPSGVVGRWAAQHHWRYHPESADDAGSSRNVMTRTVDGVRVLSYEALATPELRSGKDESRRHVLAALVPDSRFPRVEIVARRSSWERAASDPREVPLESVDVNLRWRVTADDVRFGHAFCHPRAMERLMADVPDDVSVLVEDGAVAVHAPGPTALDQVDARARLAVDLALLTPPYLRADRAASGVTTRGRRDRRAVRTRPKEGLAGFLTFCALVLPLAALACAGVAEIAIGEVLRGVLTLLGILGAVAIVGGVLGRDRRRRPPDDRGDPPGERA